MHDFYEIEEVWEVLECMYMDDNGLKELQSCIGVLTMMTELRVAGNEIEELPGSIGIYVCVYFLCMYVIYTYAYTCMIFMCAHIHMIT
jgi:hypothetical protein